MTASGIPIAELLRRFANQGAVTWIGVRPARREPVIELDTVAVTMTGLQGDRRAQPGKRALTLIQAEHLAAISAFSHVPATFPTLRRNIAVSGINLLALRKETFRIGSAVLRGTGLCAPCSRMEETLGHGGYNAVRGHGGITAEVLEPGIVTIEDAVAWIPHYKPPEKQ